MTSYQALINEITDFYNNHVQVQKVGSDFQEQMPNFATKNEKYPIVFIVPVSALATENTNDFVLDIFCFDIIQKDRTNINVILSDCQQILYDLFTYFINSTNYNFDFVDAPTFTPLNNDLLDYAAGWVMSATFCVNNWTDCAVPLKQVGN
jgi:hypothetical protein